MWDKYSEDKAPRADISRIARIAVIAVLGIIIFAIVSNQSVTLLMNLNEFGAVFTKPLYYSILSGLILAAISLVRVNIASRHSMTWYGIKMIIIFLKRNEFESRSKPLRYSEYQMSYLSFGLWQLTKVVLFASFFANMMFGMTVEYMMHGNDIGLGSIGKIFAIPFSDIPSDGSYAQQNVIPMIPALTLFVPPLLSAIGFRILLFIGVSGVIHIISQYFTDARESKPRFLLYISKIEIIIGTTILWVGFTMFFNHLIDFNTKYAILGTLALGLAFIVYGMLDSRHARVIIYPTKKHMYSRLLTVGAVIIIAGALMAVNSSIADTKKLEWLGPYITQEISMNQYMHELGQIRNYTISQPNAPAGQQEIQKIMNDNSNNEILSNIRLWDQPNAKAKLDSLVASRNDISYSGMDVANLDGSLYWAASTSPKLPDNVSPGDQWFKEHIVYTHSDAGIKLVRAADGTVIDESKFFPQKNIYYGESSPDGIFSRYWSAFPVGRTQSDELGHLFYNGTGGVDISPPLSWMFDPTFMLYDPAATIHVMRYKEVHDRMELLYPYFVYQFGFGGTPSNPDFRDVEVYPVTDGKNTYWLMPLIALLDTSNVPWSSGASSSFMLKLVGYALIDSYNGSIQVIVTGNDYFSNMFYDQYKDVGATRQISGWLGDQIRYPEEMIMWKISKFNAYHVTNAEEHIEGKNFYALPEDTSKKEVTTPDYVIAKPAGFEKPEFVAIQPLQFAQSKDTTSKNLAGYIVVQNGIANLGKMTFYSLPADSSVKLISPSDAQGAVEKSKEYGDIKNLNKESPATGDNVLYRVANHEVYFNALFVNTVANKQVAAVAAVDAAPATGATQIGIGETPAKAFENYLQKLSGIAISSGNQQQTIPSSPPQLPTNGSNQTVVITNPDKANRIQQLEKVFADARLNVVKPTAISVPVEFQEATGVYKANSDLAPAESVIRGFVAKFAPSGGQIYEWQKGTTVNFGVLVQVNGIVENHYISIEVG